MLAKHLTVILPKYSLVTPILQRRHFDEGEEI